MDLGISYLIYIGFQILLKFDENFENLIILSILLIPFLLSIFYGLFSIY